MLADRETGSRAGSQADRSAGAAMLLAAWIAAFNVRSGLIGLDPALQALTFELERSHAQARFLVAVPAHMIGSDWAANGARF